MATLTLHNGDCLEVMKTIPEKSIDLIICDLPYGCLTGGGGKEKASRGEGNVIGGCSWDIKIDLVAFWEQVKRIRKSDHSPTIHFCTTKFGFELYASNPDEFRYDLVWSKSTAVGFLSANKMPMRSHEMIYIFSKAGAYYERKDIVGDFPAGSGGKVKKSNVYGKPLDYGENNGFNSSIPGTRTISEAGRRCPKTVLDYANKKIKGGHPTTKPEDLYRFLIERYCPVGGTVLDPTFGSGNSVFTAFSLGRTAIGIEKDVAFFKKAEERLEAL
jgi:site-specific DNA-methyltransferase (adenine-specific)